jgi:hypothetical protein
VAWWDVHIGFEGDDFRLGGLAVWKEEWRPVDTGHLNLPHPTYRDQIHRYDIYEIGEAETLVRFAAGELSNGVWGFYVPA